MDPVTITIVIGVSILVIDRVYNWCSSIIRSHCCCCDIIREKSNEANPIFDYKEIGKIKNEF